MGLKEWFRSQPEGAMTEMLWKTKESGTPVSWATICRAKRGEPVSRKSAEIIRAYTQGAVSYDSLRRGSRAVRKARAMARARTTARQQRRKAAA